MNSTQNTVRAGSTATHTPGPLESQENTHRVMGGQGLRQFETSVLFDGNVIADVFGRTFDESEANARLIAAAPDMVNVLYRLDTWLSTEVGKREWSAVEIIDNIRAAIAKAEKRG